MGHGHPMDLAGGGYAPRGEQPLVGLFWVGRRRYVPIFFLIPVLKILRLKFVQISHSTLLSSKAIVV